MQSPLTVESAGAFKVWNILLPVFEKSSGPSVGTAAADSTKTQAATEAEAAEGKNKQSH
jgi:hypothetical protein